MGTPKESAHRERVLLGVDLGGTKVLGALVGIDSVEAPRVLGTHRIEMPSAHGPEGGAGPVDLPQLVHDLLEALCDGGPEPQGIGIGLAGYIGLDGVAVASAHVPGIVGVDVAAEVERRCGVQTAVDNDGNCFALAAAALREPPSRNIAAITIGTGIGGGLILDGRLFRGARGYAGEPGHVVVDRGGPACTCGQRGCWELYASGSALGSMARRAVAEGRIEALSDRGPESVRGEDVVAAAVGGDGGAREVMEEFGEAVALGLAQVINLVDPEVVVLGGGLAEAAETFLPATRRALAANPTVSHRRIPLEVLAVGQTAGAIGAALLARPAGASSDPLATA